jgi:hypothetical protein
MTGLVVFALIVVVIAAVVIGLTVLIAETKMAVAVAVALSIVIGGLLIAMNWATTYRNDHWATCHVTDKDRGGDNGSYRIYTSDCGQLANEDSTLRNKYNSADIWQLIPDKGVVQVRIAGSRAGFFSQFPNVFEVKKTNS